MGVALNGHHSTTKATAVVSNLSTTSTVPSDINANCPRAQRDGDLAAPTNWIVSPTTAGWAVSTTNPEPNLVSRTCISERSPFRRVKGADAPACPKEEITHAWAKPGYAFNTGSWIYNKTSQLGNGTGGINQSTFWLRREVNLTQTQINNLMFWGRWNNSVSIYVNGKLATNTYSSGLADRYHFLGMNDVARAALVPNQNNVIAIRVECAYNEGDFIKNCTNAISDFGLTQNQALASIPMVKHITDASDQTLADIFTQYTKEQGAMGGTFAEYRQNVLVNQRWLGWANKSLTTPLSENPMMRLASVDKAVGNAVTQHLYSLGILHPDTKVFGGVLNISPIPGKSFGQNVLDITVEDLRTHKSGITKIEIGTQGFHDELAFIFKVAPNQITSEHLARFYASQDACDWHGGKNCSIAPGANAPYTYSNNGHGLLRYLAEVATGKPYEQILQEMGTTEIVVARENPVQRPAREPGYMIVDREPAVRWWIPLEKGIGFSASASGLLRFLMDNTGGSGGGSMDGTRSGHWANYDPNPLNKQGHAWIWNSDYAGSNRFGDLRAIRSGARYGSCEPTAGSSTDFYRLQNMSPIENRFLNIQPVNGVSQLRQSTLDDHGWPSAKWRFEPVLHSGQTVYRISNSQPNQYIQAQGTQIDAPVVSQALPSGTSVTRAYWKIVKVGDYIRLENVAAPGYFLHTENGVNPKIRNYSDSFWSTRWYTCT
jgi:CubicO group peptidase (beta-lactamase class C family)